MAQAIENQLDVEELREENKYMEEELSDLRMHID
jgi:FtsZ-binding cell division protein ZapB